MKSQKGITLASLAIYIVLIFVVLSALAVVASNFQSGVKEINGKGTENLEINTFNMYFLQEVKKLGNDITINTEGTQISFSDGNSFTCNNEVIYLKKGDDVAIKIADNITKCSFKEKIENGKTIVQVLIKAGNSDEITTDYVLNNNKSDNVYENEEQYTKKNNINQIENNI